MNEEFEQHSLFMDFEVSTDEDDPSNEEEASGESENEDYFDGSRVDGCEDEDDGEIGEYDADATGAGGDEGPVLQPQAAAVIMPMPYRHEPPPRLDEGYINDGDAPDDEHPERLLDIDWCNCGGHCQVLPSFNAGDCVCCQEIEEVVGEAERQGVSCITMAGSFEPAILDPVSLYIGWMHYTDKWRRQARSFEDRTNEKYRYVAYRNFVRWCWGYLGKDIRVQLPACVQAKVKNAYPDGAATYRGTILRPLEI